MLAVNVPFCPSGVTHSYTFLDLSPLNSPVVLSVELLMKLCATVKSTFGAIKVADPTPVTFDESVIKFILINALDFF